MREQCLKPVRDASCRISLTYFGVVKPCGNYSRFIDWFVRIQEWNARHHCLLKQFGTPLNIIPSVLRTSPYNYIYSNFLTRIQPEAPHNTYVCVFFHLPVPKFGTNAKLKKTSPVSIHKMVETKLFSTNWHHTFEPTTPAQSIRKCADSNGVVFSNQFSRLRTVRLQLNVVCNFVGRTGQHDANVDQKVTFGTSCHKNCSSISKGNRIPSIQIED